MSVRCAYITYKVGLRKINIRKISYWFFTTSYRTEWYDKDLIFANEHSDLRDKESVYRKYLIYIGQIKEALKK